MTDVTLQERRVKEEEEEEEEGVRRQEERNIGLNSPRGHKGGGEERRGWGGRERNTGCLNGLINKAIKHSSSLSSPPSSFSLLLSFLFWGWKKSEGMREKWDLFHESKLSGAITIKKEGERKRRVHKNLP